MGKIIDLTNKKFGKLTVIKQDGRDNSGKIMWLCQCDCGTEKRIRGNDLRQGKTISCGCEGHKRREEGYKKYIEYKKDNPGYNIDLTGQRFGRLTVIGFNQEETKIKRQETSQESSWWDCKCDCGANVTVMNTNLIHGKTKSCGCLQKEAASRNIKIAQPLGSEARLIDLTGKVFYNLTVLGRAEENTKFNKPRWQCRCKCGNLVEVPGELLRRGDTKSCGCLGKSLGQDIIRNILIKNNINFETEFKFDDLKDKSCLRFDFALFDENEKLKKLIEFDGRQHTDTTSIWYTETVVKHDQMKNDYCKNNNIPLLRISYKDIDKISLSFLLNEISL